MGGKGRPAETEYNTQLSIENTAVEIERLSCCILCIHHMAPRFQGAQFSQIYKFSLNMSFVTKRVLIRGNGEIDFVWDLCSSTGMPVIVPEFDPRHICQFFLILLLLVEYCTKP